SYLKTERVAASRVLASRIDTGYTGDKRQMIDALESALYASKICSYAQGMALIRAGSQNYKWNINLAECARIWKGGCIIRAQMLDRIKQAFQRQPDMPNLLLDQELGQFCVEAQPKWREVVSTAIKLGIPVPALSGSLAYFDAYRTER